ncbi:MAG: magnesium/cobalt transporter CorA, partial [Planctomycetota bacterium]|nr:magnesium/cobalt transporter CorA [Planctomycetota bacterium]
RLEYRLSCPSPWTTKDLVCVCREYFPLLEQFGERLDDLEDRITDHPPRAIIRQVHDVRIELREVRRVVWQQREALNVLLRDATPLISDETRTYLRDCYDQTIQLVELLEVDHETCSDLRDVYLSAISNRMNEIMMVLTIIATILIPLSFIASLDGMNFRPEASPLNMPEVNWYFGYPFALGLMVATVIGMLLFFRHRGWIWRTRESQGERR